MSRREQIGRYLILLPPVAGVIAIASVLPIPQAESYHRFADQRTVLPRLLKGD